MGNSPPSNDNHSNNINSDLLKHQSPFDIFTLIPKPNVIFYHSTSPLSTSKSSYCITSSSSKNSDTSLNSSANTTANSVTVENNSPLINKLNLKNFSPKLSKRKFSDNDLMELDMKTIIKKQFQNHSSQNIMKYLLHKKEQMHFNNKQAHKIKELNHNTLFIYDWDDTLLCTSYLSPKGFLYDTFRISKQEKYLLSLAEEYVYDILYKSIEKGYVYIITNSGIGWVEYSCEKFYPKVLSLLEKLTIISARTEFEKKFPGDSKMWKMMAFDKMKNNHNENSINNIICIGDSFIEIEAGQMLTNKYRNAVVKTVKFREKVNIEEMNKQLKLVSGQFDKIYSYKKNLKIKVDKKKKTEW